MGTEWEQNGNKIGIEEFIERVRQKLSQKFSKEEIRVNRQTLIINHHHHDTPQQKCNMRFRRFQVVLGVVGLVFVCCIGFVPNATAQGEEAAGGNPFAGDPTAITLGKVTFEAQCATQCHPKEADWKGGKYPDLFDCEWLHGGSDADMFKTVTEGVPKTEMLGWKDKLSDDVLWKVIAYLKSASQCKESSARSFETAPTVLAEAAH